MKNKYLDDLQLVVEFLENCTIHELQNTPNDTLIRFEGLMERLRTIDKVVPYVKRSAA